PGAADQPAGNGVDAERRQRHGQQEDTGADHRSDYDRTSHPDSELLVPLGFELGRTCQPSYAGRHPASPQPWQFRRVGLVAPAFIAGVKMRALIFPGQGSQAVGMGAALAGASRAAKDVFDEVDEALGKNLFRLMRDGPDEELKLTENAQPAIMANSIAVLRTMGVRLADVASFVAGHSLGEYSALCAAGSFDLATTAKLLKLRGQAMQQAVPVGEGAMAALLGTDLGLAQKIAEAAAEGEVCTVANDNDPTQVVISGQKSAIDRAIAIAKDMGAKRAVPLPVSAPFHCPLMQP